MGHKTIKAIVTKIVRFEELDYWPNVINGTFTKKEAEEIFNRYFEANPPDFNNDWIFYCKELISSELQVFHDNLKKIIWVSPISIKLFSVPPNGGGMLDWKKD